MRQRTLLIEMFDTPDTRQHRLLNARAALPAMKDHAGPVRLGGLRAWAGKWQGDGDLTHAIAPLSDSDGCYRPPRES